MAFNLTFGGEEIDLLSIKDREAYDRLDALPKNTREKVAKEIVEGRSAEDILQLIDHLSRLCFDFRGLLFIREGLQSFLGNLLQAYVNKLDGERFYQAYKEDNFAGLENFKFSPQSSRVFNLLARLAEEKSIQTSNPDYRLNLASNIANKVWNQIILDLRMLDPTLSPVSVEFVREMQNFAANIKLLNTILNNNLEPQLASVKQDPQVMAAVSAVKAAAREEEEKGTLSPEGCQKVLQSTDELLAGKLSFPDYEAQAEKIANSAEKLRGLSKLMLELAALFGGAALVASATGVGAPVGVALGALSLGLIAASAGFFAASKIVANKAKAEEVVVEMTGGPVPLNRV